MKWCFNKKHNCISALAFKRQRVWYPKIIASLSAFITLAHSLGTAELSPVIIFLHAYPKTIQSTFSLPEFVKKKKKSSLLHLFIFVIQSILDFRDKTVHTYFWTWPPENNFDQFFIFVSLLQHAKNRLIPSAHSSDTIFQSPIIRLATPIFDHTHPINLQSPFNLREFVPASKTQLISSFHFWKQSIFGSQRPNWPIHFRPRPPKKFW